MLMHHRIQVIPWVAGEAEEVLEALMKGKLEPRLSIRTHIAEEAAQG